MGAALAEAPEMPSAEEIDEARAAAEAADDAVEYVLEEPGMDPELETPSGQFALVVGGKEPTSNSLRVSGGKVDTEAEYEKGTTVKFVQEFRVDEVHFIDKKDPKTGQVVASERKHVLKPLSPPKVTRLAG